jgi:hypothetical protein
MFMSVQGVIRHYDVFLCFLYIAFSSSALTVYSKICRKLPVLLSVTNYVICSRWAAPSIAFNACSHTSTDVPVPKRWTRIVHI